MQTSSRQYVFNYADDFISRQVNWGFLHAEMCAGLAVSTWEKKFVSAGIYESFKKQEITEAFSNPERVLNGASLRFFNELPTFESKLKYLALYSKDILHPFWLVFLRKNKVVESTAIINKATAIDCYDTEIRCKFPYLNRIIKDLPFKEVGRILVFITEPNNSTFPHFDAANEEQREGKKPDDFLWFTTKDKRIYLFNENGGESGNEKIFPQTDKRFLTWNEMCYHGTEPSPFLNFSIRVDGVFTDEFKTTCSY